MVNLAAALRHLAQLAEAWPGGAAAFESQRLLGSPTWFWLLEQVLAASRAPEFTDQSAADVLCALSRLDGLSPPILEALHGPLARALRSTHLSSRCLADLLWAFGNDTSLQQLLVALKQPLLEAVSTHAAGLDARVRSAGSHRKSVCTTERRLVTLSSCCLARVWPPPGGCWAGLEAPSWMRPGRQCLFCFRAWHGRRQPLQIQCSCRASVR